MWPLGRSRGERGAVSEVSWELSFSGLSCRPPFVRAVSGAAAAGASASERSVVPADKRVSRVNGVQLAPSLAPHPKKKEEGKKRGSGLTRRVIISCLCGSYFDVFCLFNGMSDLILSITSLSSKCISYILR